MRMVNLLIMIGASAANAEILVMVSAARLLRSQLVAQVRTIGPTFVSFFLWTRSMTFCDIPIILFTDLHMGEREVFVITIHIYEIANERR